MNNIEKDFRKFATSNKVGGHYLSGLEFDDYVKYMTKMSFQSPTIIENTPHFGVSIDIFSRMMMDRIICMYSEIDETVGSIISSQLIYLNSVSETDPVSLYISSPGGSVVDGLNVYDSARYIEAPITTIVTGYACSMASVILASGDKRLGHKHSRVMIHPASSGFYGKVADVEVSFNELNKLNNELFEILSAHTGHSIDDIKGICRSTDRWFNAQEALDFNIIDKILEPKKPILTANKKNIVEP